MIKIIKSTHLVEKVRRKMDFSASEISFKSPKVIGTHV